MTERYVVAALYKFAPLAELESLRAELLSLCNENGVAGTLLLAPEGINGTVAGTRTGIDVLTAFLRRHPALAEGMEYKESFSGDAPFYRMKVRLKKEIVTIGLPNIDPTAAVGAYLTPAEWNAVISDPGTIVIDTRNHYEAEIGTFKNALNPRTKTFRDFPAWAEKHLHGRKDRKIAMFCTGGIRCEKASSYMKQAGFGEVYHLKGGILKYLEEVPAGNSLWEGECFVFDQRVAVSHGLEQGSYVLCSSCRRPVGEEDRRSPLYAEGISCPACHATLTPTRRARLAERQKQVGLARARGEKHIGAVMEGE